MDGPVVRPIWRPLAASVGLPGAPRGTDGAAGVRLTPESVVRPRWHTDARYISGEAFSDGGFDLSLVVSLDVASASSGAGLSQITRSVTF
jgi:hypothetical protein